MSAYNLAVFSAVISYEFIWEPHWNQQSLIPTTFGNINQRFFWQKLKSGDGVYTDTSNDVAWLKRWLDNFVISIFKLPYFCFSTEYKNKLILLEIKSSKFNWPFRFRAPTYDNTLTANGQGTMIMSPLI